MIYRVVVDGEEIYDISNNMRLLNPSLSMELNSAGSLDFKMERTHEFFNIPQLLSSDVEVYENNELLWYGRIITVDYDIYNNKKIHCEGPLAFFNDSIQRPKVYEDTTVHAFFNDIIQKHNDVVPLNRRFTVGDITVDDISIYREVNYETTFDVLSKMCLDAEGGYFFFRKENDLNYIDWLSDMPEIGVQPVQFALNLIDISKVINGDEITTSIIPLGAENDDGEKLTVKELNGGLDYLDSPLVSQYGRIEKIIEFENIYLQSELLYKAQKWLNDEQYDNLSIECNAAELHYIDDTYPPFRIGQKVRVISPNNEIDHVYPLVKLSISLDSPTKKVTLGTQEKRELTEIYKPKED